MINDDYYNILELTDEDIISDDSTGNTDNTAGIAFHDTKSMFEYMRKNYTHCMSFSIKVSGSIDYFWDNYVPSLFRKLYMLFNVYEMEYAEPFFMDSGCYYNANMKYDYSKMRMSDYHACRILCYDGDKIIYKFPIRIFVYCNLPQFNTLKTAYGFISRILRIIEYEQYSDLSLFIFGDDIYSFKRSVNVYIRKSEDKKNDSFAKTQYTWVLYDIINSLACLVPQLKDRLPILGTQQSMYEFLKKHCM